MEQFVDQDALAARRGLFARALLLRVALAIVLHLFVAETLLAPDQLTYDALGRAQAAYWRGDLVSPPTRALEGGYRGYVFVVGTLYFVFGPVSLIPKLLNAVLGAFLVLVVWDIGFRSTLNIHVARRVATYVSYFPSVVLWSALNIRDAWSILIIAVVVRQALVCQDRLQPRAALILGAAVLALVQFRAYLLFPVALPIALAVVVRNSRNIIRNTVLGMILIGVIVLVDSSAGMGRSHRLLDLEELSETRHWMGVGAESSFEAVDISTPGRAVAFLPGALVVFLLAPFPWMIGSVRQLLAQPETLFFYSLLPWMWRGIVHLLREHRERTLAVILMTAAMTLGYALAEGNAGTAYRHRAQMLPYYLLFAAVGKERAADRRRRTDPGASPMNA